MRPGFAALSGIVLTTGLVACSSSDAGLESNDAGAVQPGFTAAAVRELAATQLGKYIGRAVPSSVTTRTNFTDYEFDSNNGDGPICLWGDGYRAWVRDDGPSENLFIYLEGGGACWTGFCKANTTATKGVFPQGILDDGASTNVVASWNLLFVPYCDGSLFMGDNDVPDTDPTTNLPALRHQRGLRNLTAALDVAKKRFPNAKRILLAGSSAGGYGTLLGTALVRLEYPHAELTVFNDSGLGLSNPAIPETFQIQAQDWQFEPLLPPSCSACRNGTLTSLIGWALANDPTLRVAGYSSYDDAIIGPDFVGATGPAFKALLTSATGVIHDQFPARFERFFIDGNDHMTLVSSDSVDGVFGYTVPSDGESVSDWTKSMVNGSTGWVDHLETGDGGCGPSCNSVLRDGSVR